MMWPNVPLGVQHAWEAPHLTVVDEFGGVVGQIVTRMTGVSR